MICPHACDKDSAHVDCRNALGKVPAEYIQCCAVHTLDYGVHFRDCNQFLVMLAISPSKRPCFSLLQASGYLPRILSRAKGRFFLNSSTPRAEPSCCVQLADIAPYDIPSTPIPNVRKDDMYTPHVGISQCCFTCIQSSCWSGVWTRMMMQDRSGILTLRPAGKSKQVSGRPRAWTFR